jgi:hypothetical protein
MKVTTKIRKGHYYHIKSGLHIVMCEGEVSNYWNIWNDEDCTIEWMVAIPTKWQAVEHINKYYNY